MKPQWTNNLTKYIINILQIIIKVFMLFSILVCLYFWLAYQPNTINHFIKNFNANNIKHIFYSSAYSLSYILKNNQKYVIYLDNTLTTIIIPQIYTYANLHMTFLANPSNILNLGIIYYIGTLVLNYIKPDVKTLTLDTTIKTTFTDVVGMKSIKKELGEIINIYENPHLYKQLNVKTPKGILFTGNPGNGKTFIAKALSGEIDCEFFSASAAQFIEIYVGTGPKRIRELFEKAYKSGKKAIIFIDEADAIGKKRGKDNNSERDATLNELLVHMDGLKSEDNILVILATNDVKDFDSALMRRLEVQISFENPNYDERLELLKHFTQKIRLKNIHLENIAAGLYAFSRAKIKTLVNNAKQLAAMHNRSYICDDDLEESALRLDMGRKIENIVIRPEEKWRTAYHEAGHAFLFYYYYKKGVFLNPPRYLTIVPRAHALGFVAPYVTDEYQSQTSQFISAYIMVCLAGLLCELSFCEGNASIGCSSDLQMAREQAEKYITFGLSNTFGAVGKTNELQNLSIKEQNLKFKEVSRFIESMKKECAQIIEQYKDSIKLIAREAYYTSHLYSHEIINIIENNIHRDYAPVLSKRIFTFKV